MERAGVRDVDAFGRLEMLFDSVEEEAVRAADLKQAFVARGIDEPLQFAEAQSEVFAEVAFVGSVVAELRAGEELLVVEAEEFLVAQAHVGEDVAARLAAQDAFVELTRALTAADDASVLGRFVRGRESSLGGRGRRHVRTTPRP